MRRTLLSMLIASLPVVAQAAPIPFLGTVAESGTGWDGTLSGVAGSSLAFNAVVVPEPASALLLGTGALGLLTARRSRRRRAVAGAGHRNARATRRSGDDAPV